MFINQTSELSCDPLLRRRSCRSIAGGKSALGANLFSEMIEGRHLAPQGAFLKVTRHFIGIVPYSIFMVYV